MVAVELSGFLLRGVGTLLTDSPRRPSEKPKTRTGEAVSPIVFRVRCLFVQHCKRAFARRRYTGGFVACLRLD